MLILDEHMVQIEDLCLSKDGAKPRKRTNENTIVFLREQNAEFLKELLRNGHIDQEYFARTEDTIENLLQ
jgi:hypothetical protein